MQTPRPKSPAPPASDKPRGLTRAALQRQLDELFAIFDGIEGAVYVADMQTYEILAVNRYITAQFGPDLVGRKCYEMFQTGASRPCSFCTNDRLLGPDGQPGPPVRWEFQNTRNRRWYQCIDRAIHWPDGRVVRMEIALDVSRVRQTQARVAELQAELNRVARLANLGALLAGIAHELNQPLSAIAAFASACRLQVENQTAERRTLLSDLQAVEEQAHRAGAIIRRLREFVRKREPRRAAAAVRELIDDILQILNGELRMAHVRVRTDLPADLPTVQVDTVEIQQVLVNLFTNAIEAMHDAPADRRELRVQAAPVDAGRVLIAVSDRGHGLAPDAADRLFEPFFTTKPGGMGMGLAISRMLIEAHGGRLWAEPNADGGAIFRFTLPGAEACPNDP